MPVHKLANGGLVEVVTEARVDHKAAMRSSGDRTKIEQSTDREIRQVRSDREIRQVRTET